MYPKFTQNKVIQIIPDHEILQERLLESLASVKSRDSQSIIYFSLKLCVVSENILFIKI